jgi:hypothetical protein
MDTLNDICDAVRVQRFVDVDVGIEAARADEELDEFLNCGLLRILLACGPLIRVNPFHKKGLEGNVGLKQGVCTVSIYEAVVSATRAMVIRTEERRVGLESVHTLGNDIGGMTVLWCCFLPLRRWLASTISLALARGGWCFVSAALDLERMSVYNGR